MATVQLDQILDVIGCESTVPDNELKVLFRTFGDILYIRRWSSGAGKHHAFIIYANKNSIVNCTAHPPNMPREWRASRLNPDLYARVNSLLPPHARGTLPPDVAARQNQTDGSASNPSQPPKAVGNQEYSSQVPFPVSVAGSAPDRGWMTRQDAASASLARPTSPASPPPSFWRGLPDPGSVPFQNQGAFQNAPFWAAPQAPLGPYTPPPLHDFDDFDMISRDRSPPGADIPMRRVSSPVPLASATVPYVRPSGSFSAFSRKATPPPPPPPSRYNTRDSFASSSSSRPGRVSPPASPNFHPSRFPSVWNRENGRTQLTGVPPVRGRYDRDDGAVPRRPSSPPLFRHRNGSRSPSRTRSKSPLPRERFRRSPARQTRFDRHHSRSRSQSTERGPPRSPRATRENRTWPGLKENGSSSAGGSFDQRHSMPYVPNGSLSSPAAVKKAPIPITKEPSTSESASSDQSPMPPHTPDAIEVDDPSKAPSESSDSLISTLRIEKATPSDWLTVAAEFSARKDLDTAYKIASAGLEELELHPPKDPSSLKPLLFFLANTQTALARQISDPTTAEPLLLKAAHFIDRAQEATPGETVTLEWLKKQLLDPNPIDWSSLDLPATITRSSNSSTGILAPDQFVLRLSDAHEARAQSERKVMQIERERAMLEQQVASLQASLKQEIDRSAQLNSIIAAGAGKTKAAPSYPSVVALTPGTLSPEEAARLRDRIKQLETERDGALAMIDHQLRQKRQAEDAEHEERLRRRRLEDELIALKGAAVPILSKT